MIDPQILIDKIEDLSTKNAKLELALNLLFSDSHMPSTRPCSTCDRISELISKSFGCKKKRNE